MRRSLLIAFGAALLATSLAFTQDAAPQAGAPDEDPPSRAARLSFLSGAVSFQPGSVDEWTPATLNRPLTTGDRLWTDAGARAEMNLGSAALRLNGRTSFTFLNLDDNTTQVQVSSGSLSVRVRRLEDDETFEIDTPQMALTVLRPGEYRVDVNEDGDATVASVRGGTAEAVAGSQSYTIQPREQLRVSGTDSFVFDQRPIPPADGFDNFCENRDRREDLSVSAQHVSRDIPGTADLDAAGVWRETPDYGWVWAPAGMPVGWAPYHYGHWAWIAPWGWTWVDDAPWGYAPFHYGRWVFAGGWAWVPGPVVARPVYAPAMVAWVGGGGFSVGVSVGPAVGWFPLGPREVWVPPYRHSDAYITRVNVTNTVIVNRTTITNVNVTNVTYVNRNVAGAVTVMPRARMVAGASVSAAAVRPSGAMLAGARVQTTSMAAPERSAVLGVHAGAAAPAPPAAFASRQVVARRAPPPPPVSFARQQQALSRNPGQPLPRGTLSQIQGPPPQRPQIRQATVPGGGRQTGAPPARPNSAITPQRGPQVPAQPQNEARPAARGPIEQNRPPAEPGGARQNEARPAARGPIEQSRPGAEPGGARPQITPAPRVPAEPPRTEPGARQNGVQPARPAETVRPPREPQVQRPPQNTPRQEARPTEPRPEARPNEARPNTERPAPPPERRTTSRPEPKRTQKPEERKDDHK